MSRAGSASLDVFEPVLIKLRAEAAAHFGSASVRLAPTDAQERRFSYLLRVAVHRASDTPSSHVFVKVYKPQTIDGIEGGRRRVVKDFEITRHVYESMMAIDELGAVRPIACYPDDLAIVTEQVEGPTLLDFLNARATWIRSGADIRALKETMATVGRWIRAFQATSTPGTCISPKELKDYLDVRLRRMVDARGFTEARRGAILQHVDQLAERIAPAELHAVPVHSDMSLGNILVSGRRVVVLDFAMSRAGTRLHDLSRVAIQLDLLAVKPHFRRRTVQELEQALIEGFDPRLTTDSPLFRLHLLIHRVNHLLTLTVRKTSVGEAMYNQVVRRRHSRWIADELGAER